MQIAKPMRLSCFPGQPRRESSPLASAIRTGEIVRSGDESAEELELRQAVQSAAHRLRLASASIDAIRAKREDRPDSTSRTLTELENEKNNAAEALRIALQRFQANIFRHSRFENDDKP
jgi:hypothetical protein